VSARRRLDHVAVAVRDTKEALTYFVERLGLPLLRSEELAAPPVRLTYLDAGNILIQLVEPLDDETEIARSIHENGEGLHHICFAVDDVTRTATELAEDTTVPPILGSGRGPDGTERVTAFVPGHAPFGVRIECVEYRPEDDTKPITTA
jgi:methylmalonyl-CoA/ethylmalonyl-CoA epimerase